MILLNFFIAAMLVGLAIALGGVDKLQVFWDTPSFLIVGFVVLLLTAASGKWKLFLRGLAEAALYGPMRPCPEAAQVAALFRYLTYGNLLGGVLGTVIGLVLMLCDLDMDKIGVGMAVSLLTVFYSVFISLFLLMPIRQRFEQSVLEQSIPVQGYEGSPR